MSYTAYTQPVPYVPSTDTYIAMHSAIKAAIAKLRHSALSALLARKAELVVASVSSIFGLGAPQAYCNHVLSLRTGKPIARKLLLRQLVDIQLARNDIAFQRGRFRDWGDVVEIFPASRAAHAIRVAFFGAAIARILVLDA